MSADGTNKLNICISFIKEQIKLRGLNSGDCRSPPFFLGINGVQGIGKTSLVSAIAGLLRQAPFYIRTTVLSLDDFYLTRDDQLNLAARHPRNPLIQHRGQPSTHDLDLAILTLGSLRARRETKIPKYDKSAFQGQGDRVREDKWIEVNGDRQSPIDLVILEGWCLGFRALDDDQLAASWKEAVRARERDQAYRGKLGHNRLEDLQFINHALKEYDAITSQLDALIHLDTDDPLYVYDWRLEQEASLRQSKGSGMTDAEVINFVNGCLLAPVLFDAKKPKLTEIDYPSYELFTERLRVGAIDGKKGSQLRLVLGKDRGVKQVMQI
ncbi:MAG: hypothetical protein Q9219_001136 [cf. Caloplaca sp. 3 TL-2023]